jgi:hypothetical protein
MKRKPLALLSPDRQPAGLAAWLRYDYAGMEVARNVHGIGDVVKKAFTADDAEATAIAALGFVASDPELLPRFLQLTGIEASAIRKAAAEPGFLAGVLDFLVAHEPTLVAFAEASGTKPEEIMLARRMLPAGDERYERST